MRKMRYAADDIVERLRRVESLIANGATIGEAAETVGVKYSTVYQWRRRYANLAGTGVEALRRLEAENARLRRSLLELEEVSMRREVNVLI